MAEDLEKKIAVLEQRLVMYENDATTKAYYSLNRIVNMQVEYLNSFNLKQEIGQNAKEDKTYDRAKGLWESLKDLTQDLNNLRLDLKLTGDEDKDTARKTFVDKIAEQRK